MRLSEPLGCAACGVLLSVSGWSASATAATLRFTDVSEQAGLVYTGPSYTAAAADYDRDGWPDLAVSNHGQVALFRNTGTGAFQDVTDPAVFEPRTDSHGLAWVDFDRDRWPDLYVSRGDELGEGTRSNVLLGNVEGRFHIVALEPPLANLNGRGRSATPWDINRDGWLDLFINNFVSDDSRPVLALYADGGFTNVTDSYGWADAAASDLTIVPDGGDTLFIGHGHPRAGGRIWRLTPAGRLVPWSARLNVPKDTHMRVVAVSAGDVDNDLDPDLYYVRRTRWTEGVSLEERTLRFLYTVGRPGTEKGFRVCGRGRLSMEFWKDGVTDSQLARLGANGITLPKQPWRLPFDSLMFRGAPADVAGEPGLFIWHDAEGCLAVRFRGKRGELHSAGGRMSFSQPPSAVEPLDPERRLTSTPNRLYLNTGARFTESGDEWGVGDPGPGMDAVFADFDNDGWLDLYVVNGSLFGNPPNRLYRNRGRGRFAEVSASAGAEGLSEGRGASVVALDYDQDGDLDLFMTNGAGPAPERERGSYQLLRNDTSGGNWLMVDLESSISNTMALGARLELRAGRRSQSRTLVGGTGSMSTSWLPVHFGMGHAEAGSLTVYWPSGQTQQLPVRANERITVTEPLPPSSWDSR